MLSHIRRIKLFIVFRSVLGLAGTAFVMLALPVASAVAQERVVVRASENDGYGRIVFQWPGTITFKARQNGNQIDLTFPRPFLADLQTALVRVPAYVKSMTQVGDRAVRLDLVKPATLRTETSGRLAIVDLRDSKTTSSTRQSIPVRGGEDNGRSRIVFDWMAPVEFTSVRGKNQLTLTFANAADFNTRRLGLRNLSRVTDFSASSDGRTVTLSVTDDSAEKIFRVGPKLVVDFRQGKVTVTEKPAEKKETKETKEKKAVETATDTKTKSKIEKKKPISLNPEKTETPVLKKKSEKETNKTADKKSGEVPKKKGTVTIGSAEDLKKLAEAVKSSRLNAADPTLEVKQPASRQNSGTRTGTVGGSNTGQKSGQQSGQTTSGQAGQRNPTGLPPAKTLSEAVTKTAPVRSGGLSKELLTYSPNVDENRLDVYAVEDEKNARLIFPFQRPVAAAAFSRLDHVWVVFARFTNAKLDTIRQSAPSIVSAQQVRSENYTVLRFRSRPGLFPHIRREQAFWILEFNAQGLRLTRELTPVVRPVGDKGPQVYIPSLDNGDRTVVRDPEVGDQLQIVPTLVSGAGVPGERRYVDFDILASLQGVVMRPKSDGVNLEAKRERVVIRGNRGLSLSNPGLSVSTNKKNAVAATGSVPLLDLAGWRGNDEQSYIEKRTEQQNALALAPPGRRNEMRMALARMMIGHGMGHETFAVLELIRQDDGDYKDDPTFRAIRGISHLLSGRWTDADKDLKAPILDKFPDIYLWRAYLRANQGEYKEAAKLFPVGAGHLPEQPTNMQKRLLLSWLRTTSEVADEANFNSAAAALQQFVSDKKVSDALAWMQGRQALRKERFADAEKFLQQAIDSGSRPYSVFARRDMIRAKMALKKMDYAAAMNELARLRFAWRGDDFELQVTSWLADLNFEQKEYRRGLKILREAVKSYPKSKMIDKLAEKMRTTFTDLFLNKKADELKPVTALALYYDFQELTPLGKKGDEMIRKLADRLANVDLLDRAATLLEHQVRFRLRGQEKARVGTRLAVIYLLNKQAPKALEALKDSEFNLLSPEHKSERRYLQVRALAETGKAKEALDLLDNDNSQQAQQLRVDIHWDSQNWPAAAQFLDIYLGRRWDQDKPLTEREQQQVVQLAITRYLSDDAAGLTLVKDRYGEKMQKSRFAETFRVITHNIDPSKTSFRDLAPAIAGIPDFEAFMASYRDKIRSGGVSALN